MSAALPSPLVQFSRRIRFIQTKILRNRGHLAGHTYLLPTLSRLPTCVFPITSFSELATALPSAEANVNGSNDGGRSVLNFAACKAAACRSKSSIAGRARTWAYEGVTSADRHLGIPAAGMKHATISVHHLLRSARPLFFNTIKIIATHQELSVSSITPRPKQITIRIDKMKKSKNAQVFFVFQSKQYRYCGTPNPIVFPSSLSWLQLLLEFFPGLHTCLVYLFAEAFGEGGGGMGTQKTKQKRW